MSSPALEAFLARLYTDERSLAQFLKAPEPAAQAAGLDPGELAALLQLDRDALVMAAHSYHAKRAHHASPQQRARRLWPWAPRRQ